MGRAKYTITEKDLWEAWNWIRTKTQFFDRGFSSRMDFDAYLEAKQELKQIKSDNLEDTNAWCEKWLDTRAWNRLKTTVRAKRMRSGSSGKKKQVTFDYNAWLILSAIAEAENITLSDVISKHLRKAYLQTLKTDHPLQVDAFKK